MRKNAANTAIPITVVRTVIFPAAVFGSGSSCMVYDIIY
jgi:hypothetical protein